MISNIKILEQYRGFTIRYHTNGLFHTVCATCPEGNAATFGNLALLAESEFSRREDDGHFPAFVTGNCEITGDQVAAINCIGGTNYRDFQKYVIKKAIDDLWDQNEQTHSI